MSTEDVLDVQDEKPRIVRFAYWLITPSITPVHRDVLRPAVGCGRGMDWLPDRSATMTDVQGALQDSDWDQMPDFPNLTPAQAKAYPTPHGHGVMLDAMTEFFPGINCIECAKFVGRDGAMHIDYFEMSTEIASIEGTCGRCLTPTTGHES